ncbi:hypothetical protein ACJJIF_05935 [Microbulbifer sp. SSSA002]|uniref:hypothetical protein n=1 Tax=Microbulbifer sp. SSSA002 TaxID=3243376 RepID=UPI00403A3E92
MNSQINGDDKKRPLLVFPPNMSRFLLVTLALMVAHGLSISIAVIYLTDINPKLAIPISALSILIFILFNILVTRGIRLGVLGLKALSVLYLGLSLMSLIFSAGVTLCLISAACSVASLITINSVKYRDFFNYMKEARALRNVKAEVSES